MGLMINLINIDIVCWSRSLYLAVTYYTGIDRRSRADSLGSVTEFSTSDMTRRTCYCKGIIWGEYVTGCIQHSRQGAVARRERASG